MYRVSASKLAPSHSNWQEASVPHHVDLAIGWLNDLMTWQLPFSLTGLRERTRKEGVTMPFTTVESHASSFLP